MNDGNEEIITAPNNMSSTETYLAVSNKLKNKKEKNILIKNENCDTCEKASVCKYKGIILESVDVVKEVAEKYDWLDIKLICHNYLQNKQNTPLFRESYLSNSHIASKL